MELLIDHMYYYGLCTCNHISEGLACLALIRVGKYTGELFTNKVQARSHYFRKHHPRVLCSSAHAYSRSILHWQYFIWCPRQIHPVFILLHYHKLDHGHSYESHIYSYPSLTNHGLHLCEITTVGKIRALREIRVRKTPSGIDTNDSTWQLFLY